MTAGGKYHRALDLAIKGSFRLHTVLFGRNTVQLRNESESAQKLTFGVVFSDSATSKYCASPTPAMLQKKLPGKPRA